MNRTGSLTAGACQLNSCLSVADIALRLAKDTIDSPLLYTRNRDLHDVGVILLQMLLGLEVAHRFPDVQAALHSCTFFVIRLVRRTTNDRRNSASISSTLQQYAMNMLVPGKKHTSCMTLLSDLAETSFRTATKSSAMLIAGIQ